MTPQRPDLGTLLEPLLADANAQQAREDFCDTASSGLALVGQRAWVSGALLGPDRASGISPFDHGSDARVGLALVAQIGGEVARGAVLLLRQENRYAAAALVRQLLEVEYLAAVLAEGADDLAAEWLRSDRDARMRFWSPARLRERARRRFLPSDYHHHCELGGHPTPRSGSLLPDHESALRAEFLWVDLAGHLAAVWEHVLSAADRDPLRVVDDDECLSARATIEEWSQRDALFRALQGRGDLLRGEDGSGPLERTGFES